MFTSLPRLPLIPFHLAIFAFSPLTLMTPTSTACHPAVLLSDTSSLTNMSIAFFFFHYLAFLNAISLTVYFLTTQSDATCLHSLSPSKFLHVSAGSSTRPSPGFRLAGHLLLLFGNTSIDLSVPYVFRCASYCISCSDQLIPGLLHAQPAWIAISRVHERLE